MHTNEKQNRTCLYEYRLYEQNYCWKLKARFPQRPFWSFSTTANKTHVPGYLLCIPCVFFHNDWFARLYLLCNDKKKRASTAKYRQKPAENQFKSIVLNRTNKRSKASALAQNFLPDMCGLETQTQFTWHPGLCLRGFRCKRRHQFCIHPTFRW